LAGSLILFTLVRVPPVVPKAEAKLAFETTFRVKGKVVESVMCDCEEEGHVGLRVSRQMNRGGWAYSKEDRNSYIDVVAYSSDGQYVRLRPGDWVEADVTIRGRISHVPTGELDRRGISDGHRYEGRLSKVSPSAIEVDFGTFLAGIKGRDADAFHRAVDAEGLRKGGYVESECAVEAALIKSGSKEEILGHSRRVFPRRSH